MTETILAAESGIQVGHHTEAHWFGLTVNTDTLLSTAIAAVIVLGLAFFLRAKVTSTGVPNGVQLFWETITVQLRNQIESAIGMKVAPFVLPLAVTLFVFILVANWLSVLPLQYKDPSGVHELLKPAASDINFVLALALFVFICYHAAGVWRRGVLGHPVKLLKGHVALMAPINLVEEIAKPISLSLRLFGNIFAGGILVALIAALIPPYIMWLPNAIWKSFDLFVGAIQAFIFALLTILYFSQSMELEDDHH
jgi:F-type H+-transporting ATPase subunit a